ncbi:MAG: hypothetical protein VX017_00790, partial [Pseudomonadota bacterium]|nr:hypothetical protein [Pseudomonadota bacterium]
MPEAGAKEGCGETIRRDGRRCRLVPVMSGNGALGKIRTPDPQIRSLVANSFSLLIRTKLSAYMQLKQQF